MRRRDIDIELRGQLVTIEFAIQDPEPDVGLMGYGFEDESITDADGNALDWELTDAERDIVTEKVGRLARDLECEDESY